MAATIAIEEESGTYSGRPHPHNGYYAGNFSTGADGNAGIAQPSASPTALRSLTSSSVR